jgi:acyl-CoA reductase-like NAD-dependent aldehyde dehydrogenase
MTVQTSFNPRNGLVVPAPAPDTPEAVDAVVATAVAAAEPMAAVPPATRAGWLTAIADAVEADAEPLAALADEETALGLPRLTGELAGAARALRFYGSVAGEGSYLQAAIDHAAPGRSRPDVRRVNVPLGPVAVFGASNFPFGFGVLGHDTASALAAGCPVVVKAHPAHPRLSARLAEIAGEAMAGAGVTTGPFGIVHGFDAGTRLVSHPAVRAVGFTGSLAGGLALWRLAASRPEVIPVYAEMGTVNTVVVTPSAAAERPAEIAAGFVGSFTLGMGQFCTKPGLLAPAGSGLAEETGRALAATAPGRLAADRGDRRRLPQRARQAGQRAVGIVGRRRGAVAVALRTEDTATGFFNVKIERYPDHLGRLDEHRDLLELEVNVPRPAGPVLQGLGAALGACHCGKSEVAHGAIIDEGASFMAERVLAAARAAPGQMRSLSLEPVVSLIRMGCIPGHGRFGRRLDASRCPWLSPRSGARLARRTVRRPNRCASGPRDRPPPLYTSTKVTISRMMTASGTQS